jgi:arginine decarboxylase
MAKIDGERKAQDFQDFFSAAEARIDRWRELSAVGRAWEAAVSRGQSADSSHGDAARLLTDVAVLESYWAYPGSRLMATVAEALNDRNAAVFARLVGKISMALVTGAYRHDTKAWDPMEEGEGRVLDVLPPDAQPGEAHKPYFEVLIVTPNDPNRWERSRADLRRLRRPEDSFVYEIVQVGSFEDAAIGAIFNTNVQAVVIYDGFQFQSRHDMPAMRDFLMRNLSVDPATIKPGALATALARLIKGYRPELDMYLLTDRAVEQLAGSEEVAPIRRMFHHVEELMEIHLSILDGISDRYETPYFSNLKK